MGPGVEALLEFPLSQLFGTKGWDCCVFRGSALDGDGKMKDAVWTF